MAPPPREPLAAGIHSNEGITLCHFVMIAVEFLRRVRSVSQNRLGDHTYAPPPDALGVTETRAKNYWAKHQEKIGRESRYLAVQSDVIFSEEIPN
jgi:hypothetical protein